MRLKNPFVKTGKGEARYRNLREDIGALRFRLDEMQKTLAIVLERVSPKDTYEHTAEDHGTVRLVPRASDYITGLDSAVGRKS
jgi:predicted kinase